MNKRIIVPFVMLAMAIPAYSAMAVAETGATETLDCVSAPSAPAAGATVQDRQQYKNDLQQYNQCKKNQLKNEQQNLKNQKNQFTQERCDLINQRINDRLDNFQNKQNIDTTIFGDIYKKLDNIATRLKNNGLDTSKLTGDLATLKTKIDKVNTDYTSFIAGLKDTANNTCGHSQGEFMGKLGAARGILLSVRQDRLDVKSHILNTIKPDIMALRKQLVKTEQENKTDAGAGSTNPGSPNVIQ